MKIIAHRGLLYGPDPEKENTVDSIENALDQGFDVEVDVWLYYHSHSLRLGHDKGGPALPSHLLENDKVWFHAKCIHSLRFLIKKDKRVFYHTDEDVVMTSKRELWALPGKGFAGSYIVLPETTGENIPNGALGICTDYAIKYRNMFR